VSTPPPGQAPTLAAAIRTLAEINAAHQAGATWNQIAAQYGYPSGPQAKKAAHTLRERVTRELAAVAARQAALIKATRPGAPTSTSTPPPNQANAACRTR
jgi:hypothetical protein